MSEVAFEILRVAVNIARDRQIKRLATLKEILAGMFPGQGEQIQEAINA